MIRVRTHCRLHFGLLSFPIRPIWANWEGKETIPVRRFGGVGLMIQDPGIQVIVRPAKKWCAEGPNAKRVLSFARHFARAYGVAEETLLPPQKFIVEQCAPEHSGLGTGTQMALAVGYALLSAWGLPNLRAEEIALQLGRGKRSALGIHGFVQGGFLVEAGKCQEKEVGTLVAQRRFPDDWQIIVVLPHLGHGLHGFPEHQVFQHLKEMGMPLEQTDALCRLVLLGLLPALAERDWRAFSEALYDYNVRSGEAYRSIQGGVYSRPEVAALVAFSRQQGIPGVGQSSWGPAVFAVAQDKDQAQHLVDRIRQHFSLEEQQCFQTVAANEGTFIQMPGEAFSSIKSPRKLH